MELIVVVICEEKRCVGCGACSVACHKAAIVMAEDHEGFLRPKIDMARCVGCQQCRRVCPANVDLRPKRFDMSICYGGSAKSIDEVQSSTSGGVASVLSRQIISRGGVVIGAAYDPFPLVRHVCIEDDAGLSRLKGSKYVESDIRGVLPRIRAYLNDRREVLFVGLPCQVAAVYGFLGESPKGLYTTDLVCHGKPPQKLFSLWIEELQKRVGGEIIEYRFRDKQSCQWNDPKTHHHFYRLNGGRSGSVEPGRNWYSRYFLGSASFRECCYKCQYARLPRIGDVTLADFWGAERDERFRRFGATGLSLVSVQSSKGEELLSMASDGLDLITCSPDFALSCNGGLNHCSKRTLHRRYLFKFVYFPGPVRWLLGAIAFGGAKLIRNLFKGGGL